MQFCRFLAVVCFLNLRIEAVKEKVPSGIDEIIQRKESACKCSDITPLLNKLISELENMKGQLLQEIPEQLARQAEEIKKLRNDVKGIVNDVKGIEMNITDGFKVIKEELKDVKGIDVKIAGGFKDVKEELKKAIIQEIMKSANNSNSACNDNPYLKKIESSVENVANRAKEISTNLQTHDHRLQALADMCLNNIGVCDCSTIKSNGRTTSGMYRIYVDHLGKRYYANVYCDMTTGNGAWTIFQRRKDGSVDFFRGWNDYGNGFGNPNGEFWLGNNFLHLLTSKRRYRLRIDLEDFEGGKRYAEYSTFSIGSSADKYRLSIGTYFGNAGDSLSYANGYRFSTRDSDNDGWSSGNCAARHRGAWWYNQCGGSSLNGPYLRGRFPSTNSFNGIDGVVWHLFRGFWYSLKTTEMKISSY